MIKIFCYIIIFKYVNYNCKKDENNLIYDSAKKAKEFLNISYNGFLFTKKILISFRKPKVSVVIPAYNVQNYIKQSIRSVQNQDMIELEIVVVNDFSLDNTSKIIEHLRKNDKRIKLINNKKNMGSLYSRCIGTLAANGKYIFPLDGDDMILDKDIIINIYNLAEIKRIDIIVFKAIMVEKFNEILELKNLKPIRGNINKNITYYQPELSNIASIVLWGQLIKAKLYKKAIKIYGKKKYSFYLNYYEDAIINHIIYQIANSSFFLTSYGILYLSKLGTVSNSVTEIKRNISIMKYIEIMLDFSKNTIKLKDKIETKIIFFFNNGNFEYYYQNNIEFKNEFVLLLKKIFSSKLLTLKNKINIKRKISNILLGN